MNHVFGTAKFNVSLPVEAKSEKLALLGANYRVANVISYELVAIDCRGQRHKIYVHGCENMSLFDFVE